MDRKSYTSFREVLEVHDKMICSPVTGSMRPLIRPKRDCAVLKKVDRPLKKYDVVIYASGDKTVLHRVIGVPEKNTADGTADCYRIRGDANTVCEQIPAEQIYGVMEGMYRGERYVSCDSVSYRFFSRLIVAVNPLLSFYKKIRRALSGIRWLKALYRRVKAERAKKAGSHGL